MLIGINGFKGAGKDTVGDYLVEKYGFKKASFAALLKQSAAALFDIPIEKWEEWKNDSQATITIKAEWWDSSDRNPDPYFVPGFVKQFTVREFLQRYGTESHRDVFGYDFWVEQAFKNLDLSDRLVFTDARFENELAAIIEQNGFIVQVLRQETDKEAGTHASEVRPDIRFIDEVFFNDSDKESLYDQVDDFLEPIL